MIKLFAPCKGIRIPESKKLLPVAWNPESGIQGFGIQNTAQGIRNPSKDWNPQSKFHLQRLKCSTWESGIYGVEFRIQDLDSLTWGEVNINKLININNWFSLLALEPVEIEPYISSGEDNVQCILYQQDACSFKNQIATHDWN